MKPFNTPIKMMRIFTASELRDYIKFIPYSEFKLEIMGEFLGISDEEMQDDQKWRPVGFAESFDGLGFRKYSFVCMYERISDGLRAWCPITFRMAEKYALQVSEGAARRA